jgi:D-alanyl-D-alanine carboxypeptidase/D-alanyl-D-alanine-endopeptidase (penicillin-binding protein 4)
VLLVMLAVLISAVAYFGVGAGRQYLADRSFRPIKVPAAAVPPPSVAAELASAAAVPAPSDSAPVGPMPTVGGVAIALAGKLINPDLGPSVAAQVIDAASGTVLLNRRSADLVAPASTSKLFTAAALLTVHKPTDRFTTTVVAGATPGAVVLVGGGDPTLSAAPAGQPTEYAEAARVSDLAAKVKAARAGAAVTQVIVDDSFFSGSTTGPGWASDDAPSDYASPITATMVDAGRDTPGAISRSGTPDLAAGNALAAALADPSPGSLPRAQVSLGMASVGARVLAQAQSAPVLRLAEQMLVDSDNVIAEVLARQVAIAAKRPATFAGAAAAISSTLAPLGIAVGGGMKDGSGLSGLDRIPAAALGQVLLKAVDPSHPQLRPILAALSVAGWDGTLAEQGRFAGAASGAYGVVRAKTGSLTGVSALAGLVTDKDRRLLVFSFVADKIPNADAAPSRSAIDQLAAALVACGCR